jgi:hypothetical protein
MTKEIIHHTLETLHALCNEVGECWEWKRSTNGAKMPQTRHAGKVVGARKLAFVLAGNEVKDGFYVVPKCKNYRCINPECSKQVTPAKFMKDENKGRVKSLATCEKLSTSSRRWAKLTPDDVANIRGSDKPGRQLAQEHGVALKTIWNARNNRTWQEYRSPWSGLGAR